MTETENKTMENGAFETANAPEAANPAEAVPAAEVPAAETPAPEAPAPEAPAVETPVPEAPAGSKFCAQCGAELAEGQAFCPKCGAKYDPSGSASTTPVTGSNDGIAKKGGKKKTIIAAIAAAACVILGVALFFIIRGTPVSDVSLSKATLTMDIGDTQRLVCTVSPDNAKNKKLKWTTSNASVATVDEEGKVKAVSEGTCKITVSSNNKKTDICIITVEAHIPNFKEMYSTYSTKEWCDIAADGSYMRVDTNPKNEDGDYWWNFYTAFTEGNEFIEKVNKDLGFSAALTEKMNSTTWSMGRQSQENENYSVSWTYHPDKGLEVLYEVKGK